MIGEFGQLLLSIAFVAVVAQIAMAVLFLHTRQTYYVQASMWAMYVQMATLVMGFAVLTFAFLRSDLSIRIVVENSHALVPAFYRISGVWGNHEGSLLMWSVMLAVFASLLMFRLREQSEISGYFSLLLGGFSFMLLGFMLFTSNPFARLQPPALYGAELNPILQDPFLAVHPPALYAGYIFISIACAFIFAMILSRKIDAKQWNTLHKILLIGWIFLTIGILLGSYWAYRELGWGGFWFWDPVENVSLMPWLISTAVLHAGNANKHQQHQLWIASLILIAFLLSIVGTFLVRSGLLVSPHTFASDPTRGIFLLFIFAIIFVAGFGMILRFGGQIKVQIPVYFLSRENAMFVGSMVLVSICAGVFVGTLYPLFVEVFWQQIISVGHPYYNFIFVPMGLFVVFLAGLSPYLSWQQNSVFFVLWRVGFPFLCSLFSASGVIYFFGIAYLYAGFAVAIAVWLLWSMLEVMAKLLARDGRAGLQKILSMVIAHVGLAVITIAMVGMTIFDDLATGNLDVGQSIDFGGEKIILEHIAEGASDNYFEVKAFLRLVKENGEERVLTPTRRIYAVSGVETVEPYILTEWWRDYQVILGDKLPDGRVVIRLYKKPLALWLWLGGSLIVLGGTLGLLRKRYTG